MIFPREGDRDTALARLKQLTGKNFGKDAKAWRKWVETHAK